MRLQEGGGKRRLGTGVLGASGKPNRERVARCVQKFHCRQLEAPRTCLMCTSSKKGRSAIVADLPRDRNVCMAPTASATTNATMNGRVHVLHLIMTVHKGLLVSRCSATSADSHSISHHRSFEPRLWFGAQAK